MLPHSRFDLKIHFNAHIQIIFNIYIVIKPDFFLHHISIFKTDCKVSSAVNICNGSVHNLTSNHFISNTYPQRKKSNEKETRAKGQEDKPNFE